jgi:ABC-type nitrate/sulfonate/bicarbonate transport system substrate-binding protein
MKGISSFLIAAVLLLVAPAAQAQANFTMAYVSDSPSSSVPFWVAKEAGLFNKRGLDIDLLFINGSTRAVQSLIAGILTFPARWGLPR